MSVDNPSLNNLEVICVSASLGDSLPLFLADEACSQAGAVSVKDLEGERHHRGRVAPGTLILEHLVTHAVKHVDTGFHQVALSLTVPTVSPLTETVSA